MEAHPSYQTLATILSRYPRAAGSLFQAYNDVLYGERQLATSCWKEAKYPDPLDHPSAQQWTDVEVVDLEGCERGAIKGRRPKTETTLHVIPYSLAEMVSFGWLKTAFTLLSDPPEVYLAITSEDASIVYYKISMGIVKPPV